MRVAALVRPHRLIAALAAIVMSLSAIGAQAATLGFDGAFWDADTRFRTIDEAVTYAEARTPDATFVSTAIDYPRGSRNVVRNNRVSLADYLAGDASSLIGDPNLQLNQSVFKFTGTIDLTPGLATFTVGSDDGFRLIINGQVVREQVRPRSFRETNVNVNVTGRTEFTLYYFENFGRTGVEFWANRQIIDQSVAVTQVPLPASSGFLLLAGLALFAVARRRT